MNSKVFYGVIAVIIVIGGFLVLGRGNNGSSSDTQNTISEQSSQQTFSDIETALASGAQLIDVRTPEEFTDRHIDKAINLPLGDIEQGTLPEADKDTALYVYCRSGNRSAQSKELLNNAGYTNVTDLGGIEDVINIGGTAL